MAGMAGSFVIFSEFLTEDQKLAAKMQSEGRPLQVPVPHYRLGWIFRGGRQASSVDTSWILFVAGIGIFRHFVAGICNLGFDETL